MDRIATSCTQDISWCSLEALGALILIGRTTWPLLNFQMQQLGVQIRFWWTCGSNEDQKVHDAEGEEVREKAREELREESERIGMGEHDERRELPAVEDDAPPGVSFGAGVEDMEDDFLRLEMKLIRMKIQEEQLAQAEAMRPQ